VARRIPQQARPAEAAPAPRTEPIARAADAAALHRRIPRQARAVQDVTPLSIPQQRRPA